MCAGPSRPAHINADGKVLVVGGYVPRLSDGSGYARGYEALATAHLFDPTAVE